MKKFVGIAGLAFALLGGAASAETLSELSAQGKVMLSSHYNAENKVITVIVGSVNRAPEYVCETRYRVKDGDSYDQCRALR